MNYPTIRALARLLTPWRTIQRLEAENQQLHCSNERLIDVACLAISLGRRSRDIHHCPTHGQLPPQAWGCPECVRELRQEAENLQNDLATTREAVQRLIRWCGVGSTYSSVIAISMIDWAAKGMTGPLPPLPDSAVRIEQKQNQPHE